ncbi:helix-turn-helix domain-containing protein [Mangrovibacter yixingensis]|uniref:helix-turn-helix domain-containing protein n=1 Tax=Mangrovibacter yixingensis TaxID=1529639 RepID=UPI001CFD2028|nr:helix-turn-helix transcriptional regulator [Mangrovibacter yixingensis]
MKKSSHIQAFFGAHIKKLRLQSGLSQEAFADKCGLDRTYVSGIERGVRNPTLEVINVLAKGLNVDISALFAFEKDEVDE